MGEWLACLCCYQCSSLTFSCFYKFVSDKVTDVTMRYFEGVIGSPCVLGVVVVGGGGDRGQGTDATQ